jgi:hypothetical protein
MTKTQIIKAFNSIITRSKSNIITFNISLNHSKFRLIEVLINTLYTLT